MNKIELQETLLEIIQTTKAKELIDKLEETANKPTIIQKELTQILVESKSLFTDKNER